ncbi:hypothetical protein WEI85_46520 [Actinomycetes bacterium KLBMP 9797]
MPMLSRVVRRAVLPVALLATIVFAPATASAAPPAGDDARAAAAACSITRGLYTGAYLCETTTLRTFTWVDGRQEVFVIGTDNQVWHIWQRYSGDLFWSGWYSLGGYAILGVGLWNSAPTIAVIGGFDNLRYCNGWTGLSWTGWYRC